MRHWLLPVTICSLLTLLTIPGVAAAQYLFLDINGDGLCDYQDLFQGSVDTVSVWLDTRQDRYGTPAVCSAGGEMSISGYELLLRGDTNPGGSVAFGEWTNLVPQFTYDLGTVQEGNLLRVGRSSAGSATYLPAGKYLLGKVSVQFISAQCKRVAPTNTAVIGQDQFETKFYSQCPGIAADNQIRLGSDFYDYCEVGNLCDDVKGTTWGKIKRQYR